MSSKDSSENSTIVNLLPNQIFSGRPTDAAGFTKCGISVLCDLQPLTLVVYQSISGVIIDKVERYEIPAIMRPTTPGTEFGPERRVLEINYKFVWITAQNANPTATTYCRIQTQLYNVGFLAHEHDSVTVYGENSLGEKKPILTGDDGALIVGVNMMPPISGEVSVSNFPSVQGISGSVAVTTIPPVAVLGQEPQHTFYASPDTNVSAVYADGVQGTNVNGGWSYTNTGVLGSKINWYLYGNTVEQGATAKKIKDIDFMYAIIDQKTTLGLAQGQNPFFIFYSLPDSGTNALWYKSKFFYGSNAHTNIPGVKLLYIGTDVATIHPEITGINRIPLDFVAGQSTKTVEQGADELLWLGTLQTTGNPAQPAGAFNFVFSEYGINFAEEALNPSILPLVANKVMANVTGSSVTISSALPPGTSRLGEVITIEKPASAANLTGLNDSSQQIKATPGALLNLTAFNDGNATSYVKLYNALTATSSNTPIATFPIRPDSALSTINTHNIQFSTGICVRATAGYAANDTTAPNGNTSIVAFFNGVI